MGVGGDTTDLFLKKTNKPVFKSFFKVRCTIPRCFFLSFLCLYLSEGVLTKALVSLAQTQVGHIGANWVRTVEGTPVSCFRDPNRSPSRVNFTHHPQSTFLPLSSPLSGPDLKGFVGTGNARWDAEGRRGVSSEKGSQAGPPVPARNPSGRSGARSGSSERTLAHRTRTADPLSRCSPTPLPHFLRGFGAGFPGTASPSQGARCWLALDPSSGAGPGP